jgi:hypothetical protein
VHHYTDCWGWAEIKQGFFVDVFGRGSIEIAILNPYVLCLVLGLVPPVRSSCRLSPDVMVLLLFMRFRSVGF